MAKAKKNKLPLILIGLVILVGVLLGYKLLGEQRFRLDGGIEEGVVIPDGWQVYENSEYGFSLAHPPETEVSQHMLGRQPSVDGFLIFKEGEFDLSVWVYSDSCDETCFQNELVDWWPKTKLKGQELTINGHRAMAIDFDEVGMVRREIYLTNSRGLVIYFVFEGLTSVDEPLPEDYQAVVNSVQFSD